MKIRSRTPLSARACTTYSKRGRFPTGIMTFGTDAVKGHIRAPSPAARMTAFMRDAPAEDSGGRHIPAATCIYIAGRVVRLIHSDREGGGRAGAPKQHDA